MGDHVGVVLRLRVALAEPERGAVPEGDAVPDGLRERVGAWLWVGVWLALPVALALAEPDGEEDGVAVGLRVEAGPRISLARNFWGKRAKIGGKHGLRHLGSSLTSLYSHWEWGGGWAGARSLGWGGQPPKTKPKLLQTRHFEHFCTPFKITLLTAGLQTLSQIDDPTNTPKIQRSPDGLEITP